MEAGFKVISEFRVELNLADVVVGIAVEMVEADVDMIVIIEDDAQVEFEIDSGVDIGVKVEFEISVELTIVVVIVGVVLFTIVKLAALEDDGKNFIRRKHF